MFYPQERQNAYNSTFPKMLMRGSQRPAAVYIRTAADILCTLLPDQSTALKQLHTVYGDYKNF